jgi:hypothetical protein
MAAIGKLPAYMKFSAEEENILAFWKKIDAFKVRGMSSCVWSLNPAPFVVVVKLAMVMGVCTHRVAVE